ncbi:MAG: hypothetical protein QNJ65_21655 [Xenococcaceae cyanobacterium MO_234.B1]|nr:hypothetical protein [Xenococcaceae cyanobacterium MO_234.B1]
MNQNIFMDEQEREQNKRINHHQRLINDLRERLKTVEVDVEPDGRISEAFEQIEQHLERHDKKCYCHEVFATPKMSIAECL